MKLHPFLKKMLPLIAFIMFCCAGSNISAFAQCGEIFTLAASPTNATCYNNGKITIEITGQDAANLSLNNPLYQEFRLEPINGGQFLDWAPWEIADGDIAKRISPNITPGTYNVWFRAFCEISPADWDTVRKKVEGVIVSGSYTPMTFTTTQMLKTMNCRYTGRIYMTLSVGMPSYRVEIEKAPPEYTGAMTFIPKMPVDTLFDLPAGDYTLVLYDDCYALSRDVTIDKLSHDVPRNAANSAYLPLNYSLVRVLPNSDCFSLRPGEPGTFGVPGTYAAPHPDWTYYWNNFTQYYEYAYTIGSSAPNWQPLDTRIPVYTLDPFIYPDGYKSFCESPDTLSSHVRPAGCTVSPVISTIEYSKAGNICIKNPFVNVFSGEADATNITVDIAGKDACNLLDSAKLTVGIRGRYALCYPATWSIVDMLNPVDTLQKGTIQMAHSLILYADNFYFVTGSVAYPNAIPSINYKRGNTYEITLTDGQGRVFTHFWTPPKNEKGQQFRFGAGNNNALTYCGYTHFWFVPATSGNIIDTTWVKYLSGPQDVYWGAPGNRVRAGTVSTFSFNYYATLFWSPGLYTFQITNHCGYDTIVTLKEPARILPDKLVYTTEGISCSGGLSVKPQGGVRIVEPHNGIYEVAPDPDGYIQYQYDTTYYNGYVWIKSYPSGVTVNPNRILANGTNTLTFPSYGRYILGISQTHNSCELGTDTIEYFAQPPLAINPNTILGHICRGDDHAVVRVQAIGGVPPYTYSLHTIDDEPVPCMENNGLFFLSNGPFASAYKVKVTDGCTNYSITVPLLDLRNTTIVYSIPESGVYSENELININSIALGDDLDYWWTGPGNFSMNDRRPRPVAVLAHSGMYYKVEVVPLGCTVSVIDSLKVIIYGAPSDTVYEIWNWDDLAHLMYIHNTYPATTTFKLMQDLGIPGIDTTYGNGNGLVLRSQAVQDAHKGDRRFGWFGYEGFIMQNDYDITTSYDESITSYNDLITIRNNAASVAYNSGLWTPDAHCGWDVQGWQPLGYPTTRFEKIFDGSGYAITGLWMNRPADLQQGLFAYINAAVIENLGINTSAAGIIGYTNTGALAGTMENAGIIRHCYVTGTVAGSHNNVGGLTGLASGTITGCYSTCEVSGLQGIGGLTGYAFPPMNINNCYTTGKVTGNTLVGGVLGGAHNGESIGLGSTITQCYATGVIAMSGSNPRQIGGVVGTANALDTVARCFAFNSQVSSSSLSGRLVGSGTPFLQNNYALETMTITGAFPPDKLHDNRNGANISGCQAVTDITTYTTLGWDFPDVWTFDYTNYSVKTGTDTTNLPILSVFKKADFSQAMQPPRTECSKEFCEFEHESGSENQTVCINTPIENIVYIVNNAIQEIQGPIDLPTGVSITVNDGFLTISGTPEESGTFNFELVPAGDCATETKIITIMIYSKPAPPKLKNRN